MTSLLPAIGACVLRQSLYVDSPMISIEIGAPWVMLSQHWVLEKTRQRTSLAISNHAGEIFMVPAKESEQRLGRRKCS